MKGKGKELAVVVRMEQQILTIPLATGVVLPQGGAEG